MVQLSHLYMTTEKTIALTRQTFVGKVMSLIFNMLSRFVIAFLPRSKSLLISWLQSPSAVIWSPRKETLLLFPLFPHLFAIKWWDWMPWSWMLSFKPAFSLYTSTFIKRLQFVLVILMNTMTYSLLFQALAFKVHLYFS